ncbi:MAG: class I SAM-dependent methyltransferase [Methanoculleaceae archaeon]
MRVRVMERSDLAGLEDLEWVDRSRRPYVTGERAMVPVRDGYPADMIIPERRSPDPRGYQMLGDVAVIHGPEPTPAEIGSIIRRRRPRGIIHISGISGTTRQPRARLVYGTAGEVRHRELGYTYLLNPMEVMFSQGNREEKRRIAALVRRSGRMERVADMFAGIGYFTIPIGGAGAEVHAMEINPVAYRYLLANIRENGLGARVHAELGDCRELLDGPYDRVVMGHFDAVGMLPVVFPHVEAGSVIHVHATGDLSSCICSSAEEAGFRADVKVRRVKKYAPHRWHMVHDVILS